MEDADHPAALQSSTHFAGLYLPRRRVHGRQHLGGEVSQLVVQAEAGPIPRRPVCQLADVF